MWCVPRALLTSVHGLLWTPLPAAPDHGAVVTRDPASGLARVAATASVRSSLRCSYHSWGLPPPATTCTLQGGRAFHTIVERQTNLRKKGLLLVECTY